MMKNKYLTIQKAADYLGVVPDTLRDWDKNGKLCPSRTVGKHRRYLQDDLDIFLGKKKEVLQEDKSIKVAIYARVSSQDQKNKGDLERQKNRLVEYCAKNGYKLEVILEEVASGMSDKRPKLLKLFELAETKQINKIIVEHKDRLTRFMYNIFLCYFNSYGVQIEFVEEVLPKSFENELVEDMLSLLSSFSAKIYGKRAAQNKQNKQPVK